MSILLQILLENSILPPHLHGAGSRNSPSPFHECSGIGGNFVCTSGSRNSHLILWPDGECVRGHARIQMEGFE